MKRVAIYIRVSTDEQVTKGNSLGEQEERLRAYCKAMGWDDVDLYTDDGYSAGTMNRPQLNELLKNVRKKMYSMIVTTKIDRLCRNLLDLLTIVDELEELQCGYASASESFDTSTPAGRMVLQILGAFAEFERGRIRERVKENMVSIVTKTDKAISRPCFGYDIVDGKYVINEDEAEVVRNIAKWMMAGEGSHKVMTRLNDMGVRTKEGNSFSHDAVRKLMRRETLTGTFVYNRKYVFKGKEIIRPQEEWIVIEDHHPAILDKLTFDRLNLAIQSRVVSRKHADNERYLLTGIVICGHCGMKMNGRHRKKDSGREYFHYVCRSYTKKNECFHHFILRDEVESLVLQTLLDLDEIADDEESIVAVIEKSDEQSIQDEIKSLQAKLDKLDTKMQRQLELYEDGEITKEDFRTARDRIDKQRNELKSKLELAEKDTSRAQELFLERVRSMKNELESDDRGSMKNAIRQLVHQVVITDASKIDIQLLIEP